MESLNFRFATDADVISAARLVTHSFPGSSRPLPWWVEQLREPPYGGGAGILFIGEAGGVHAAALQLHRLRQWIGGVAFDVAGVGTVAISPAHRRRGLAAQLVGAALRAAHARGDAGAALYPFRTTFYARLGFGEAGAALQYQVPPAALQDSPGRHNIAMLETFRAREEALRLYSAWIRTQTGQVERPDALWHRMATSPDRALAGYRDASGQLQGYALVTYRTDLPVRDRYLDVEEVVWLTADARAALYSWLASLGDQWPFLMLRSLPSHRLADWISEPRLPPGAAPGWQLWAPAATLLAGPMFRIVDMQRAWSQRTVRGDAFSCVVRVRDQQVPANDGPWHLDFADGRVTIERASDEAEQEAVSCDVATLSRLFVGTLPATAARDASLLTCADDTLLQKLDLALALPEAWTFDRF